MNLAKALNDNNFIDFFVNSGGGFNPLKSESLSSVDLLHRYLISDHCWRYLNHIYCPISAKGNAGQKMTYFDIEMGLKIRNIQIKKIKKFYLIYQNRLGLI